MAFGSPVQPYSGGFSRGADAGDPAAIAWARFRLRQHGVDVSRVPAWQLPELWRRYSLQRFQNPAAQYDVSPYQGTAGTPQQFIQQPTELAQIAQQLAQTLQGYGRM